MLYQTRIRVIDDFNTPQAETLAEAISDKGAEKAILDAMAIQFGVNDIVEGGTFDEQKPTVSTYRAFFCRESQLATRMNTGSIFSIRFESVELRPIIISYWTLNDGLRNPVVAYI